MSRMLRYRSIALLVAVALNACTIKTQPDKQPADNQVTADPPPTITSAAAPPPPAPTLPAAPPPVATTAAPPVVAAPAPKPVVAAPAPVNTAAACRRTFAGECTLACERKVNQSTTDANKRRIEHDICIGECARAAVSHCGS